LSLYQQHGLLFVSPGATISADQVYRDIIGTIAPQFPRLRVVGYDPAFAFDIAQRLGAQFDMIAIPQTFAFMTQPCYLLEGLLKSRRLSHQGHPILGWNMANIAVKRDEAGRLRPVKPAVSGSHRKRIDGAVALLMALGVMSRTVPTPEPEYKILFLGGAERSIGPSGW
jgi:phage terminase large subunit-like protein